MSSVALERDQRGREPAPRSGAELIDRRGLAAELDTIAKAHPGHEAEMRAAFAQAVKSALVAGRARAEELLLTDKQGRRCAERLCKMEDDAIGLLFDAVRKHLYPAQNPSEAERMAVVATGG